MNRGRISKHDVRTELPRSLLQQLRDGAARRCETSSQSVRYEGARTVIHLEDAEPANPPTRRTWSVIAEDEDGESYGFGVYADDLDEATRTAGSVVLPKHRVASITPGPGATNRLAHRN